MIKARFQQWSKDRRARVRSTGAVDADAVLHEAAMGATALNSPPDADWIPRTQMSRLLDQIGTLRLELHALDGISQCTPSLCRMLNVRDSAAAAELLHEQIPFAYCRQLLRHGVLKDLDWQLADAKGDFHRVVIGGALLGDDRLMLIANPLTHDASVESDGIFQSMFNGMLMVTADGTVDGLNFTAARLLGLPASVARGQKFASLCNRQHASRVITTREMAGIANQGDTIEMAFGPEGAPVQQHVQVRAFALDVAVPDGPKYALTLHDITWIRRSEARVHQLAFYDSLTGLANRALLITQLGRAIGVAKRHARQFALLFLDLDGFKDINDSLGHQAGDELLQAVAERMRKLLRDADFGARLGGDEFCILTGELAQAEDAGNLAARLLDALNRPYRLGSQVLTPRASIGIAVYPEHGADPEALLRTADTAMYEAKHRGKHQFAFYSDVMTARARERMSLDVELRAAIHAHQFVLVYQPQIDLGTGRMVAVEALIRWQHPQRGLLPPSEFIPAAERLGLMGDIDRWVMQAACTQLAAWHRSGMVDLRMAVNIAPTHFQRPDFADEVAAALAEAGLGPEWLEVEITERMARDVAAHATTCKALAKLGVRVAIDDFGVGYSSLSVLNGLRVHTLKVDQLFLTDVMDNPRTSLILGGIIAMARGLGLETVVEGVATREQLELVHGLGCHLAQGYLFDRPLPASKIPGRASENYLVRTPRAMTEVGVRCN